MNLFKSRHPRTPDLERHAPRVIPPTSSSRDAGRYRDDHHHSSRSGRSEYSHGQDRSHRRQDSYSPPPHHRSRHRDFDDDDYDDHRHRTRDRSRHSTRHDSTYRRRESRSPSRHHDRRPSHDDDRSRDDGHHHRHRWSDHGHGHHHQSSSGSQRPVLDRRRSRSVDDYFSSRHRDGHHAPVYYHYQSGYVPIPLHGNAFHGAARTYTTMQAPAVAPSHAYGRQPTVVPINGGRGGWVVVPPVGHSVSLMEPKTVSGHGRSTSTNVAAASHTATRGSSTVPETVPSSRAQPTKTHNIAQTYVSVQPDPGAVQAAPSTSQRSTGQRVLQPTQRTHTTTHSTGRTTSRKQNSPPQLPRSRIPPSSSRRPQKLTVPQPLTRVSGPSTSPRSAGYNAASTTPQSVTIAPPVHPVPSGVQSQPTRYMAPYGAGNSGTVQSAAPTPAMHRKSGNGKSGGKSGFTSGWGLFGSGKSRRSRGTSL